MKLNKIFLLAFIALAGVFASCDDDDDYKAGKPAGDVDVRFVEEGGQISVPVTATSFSVSLCRLSDKTKELKVPIKVLSANDSVFKDIPQEVVFAAGEDTVSFDVTVTDKVEFFKEYPFSLAIPEEYTQPYIDEDQTPTFNANVIKNDWETKYIVGYFSWWYENSQPVGLPLQYSALLDMWRVTNFAFVQGTSCFQFLWDGDVTKDAVLKLVTQSGEPQKAEIPTDLVHSKYGPVYTKWLSDVPTVYTAADKEFAIPFQWGVFIGSNWGDFGSGYDLFYLP